MPHLIISGAPSTGKSTLIRALRERFPMLEERCAFILDGGRWWMEKYEATTGNTLRIEELTAGQRTQMQLEIFEYYASRADEARRAGKIIVADAFFAEVLAYSMDCLDIASLTLIEARLCDYQKEIHALILPGVQLPLQLDGLRHVDETYREHVEVEIVATYEKYGIPYELVHTADLEERMTLAMQILSGFSKMIHVA